MKRFRFYYKNGGELKGRLQQLPEPIIQHILSYLEPNDTMRVNTLCKTLYSAWSLHPVLKLHHNDDAFSKVRKQTSYFAGEEVVVDQVREEFLNYANKSLERYRSHSQCPQQLHLTMNCERNSSSSPMIHKLLQKFEEARVKEIRVFYTTLNQPDFAVTNLFGVLECKALVEFNAERCKLLKNQIIGEEIEIRCSLLKKLILGCVCTDEDTIQSIISACPLIENLQLRHCFNLKKIKVVNHYCLKEIAIFGECFLLEVELVEVPNIESLILERVCLERGFKSYPCQNLKTLSMKGVSIGDSFFQDFASKFPNLENFSAIDCFGHKEVNISSNSLKSLTLKISSGKTEPQINAPNLVSFTYKSGKFPCFVSSLSGPASSSICECKLDLTITFLLLYDTASFFIQLKETSKRLIKSKLSLFIRFYGIGNIDNLECSSNASSSSEPEPGIEVEDLILFKPKNVPLSSTPYSTFVDYLFWSCRPKSICLDSFADFDQEFAKEFCQSLMDRKSKIGSWENDLKGVKIEMINEFDKEAKLVCIEDWRMLGEIGSQVLSSGPLKIFFRLEWYGNGRPQSSIQR